VVNHEVGFMLGRILQHMLAAVPVALALSTQGCDSDRAGDSAPPSARQAAFLASADGGEDSDGGSLADLDAGPATELDAGDDAALADAEIAGVVQRLNASLSQQGALALTRATSVNVAAFGAKLESQYLAADRALTLLLLGIAVAPQDSALSLELASAGRATLDALRIAVAPEFDRQYLLAQIAQFRQALSTIDTVLLPQTANAELRAYVQGMSAPLTDNLAEAEQVLEQLDEE
jgi:putative membrane protein